MSQCIITDPDIEEGGRGREGGSVLMNTFKYNVMMADHVLILLKRGQSINFNSTKCTALHCTALHNFLPPF